MGSLAGTKICRDKIRAIEVVILGWVKGPARNRKLYAYRFAQKNFFALVLPDQHGHLEYFEACPATLNSNDADKYLERPLYGSELVLAQVLCQFCTAKVFFVGAHNKLYEEGPSTPVCRV